MPGCWAAPGPARPIYCALTCRCAWVATHATREAPDTRLATLYDHCGRPDKVARTCYATVTVPVRKRVLVFD